MYYPGELDLIIKRDLPVVAAERKILDKLVLDLDTVKSRLDKVINNTGLGSWHSHWIGMF